MKFRLMPGDGNPYYILTYEAEPIAGFRVIVQPPINKETHLPSTLFDGLREIGLDIDTVEVEDHTEDEVERYTLHRAFGRLS